MAFNGFPDHCYFVRHLPIDRLHYKTEHLVWEDTDWCVKLEDDIRENGLIAPLLVDNTGRDLARREIPPFKVYVGHHRAQAMKRIGWTHVPCVVYGNPVDPSWESTKIKTLVNAREYFPPHENVHLWHGRIMITGTLIPEEGIYPPNKDPYWSESAEQV